VSERLMTMDVLVVDHPLVKSRLSTMRDARTDNATFRAALRDLTLMLVYEALREAPLRTEWGTPSRAVPLPEVASVVGTKAYHGAMAIDTGGVIHPGKWFAGLVGLAEAAGADLHEGVRATAIRRRRANRDATRSSRGLPGRRRVPRRVPSTIRSRSRRAGAPSGLA